MLPKCIPPHYFLINFTLAHFDKFYRTYPSVMESTPMYIAPEDQVVPWQPDWFGDIEPFPVSTADPPRSAVFRYFGIVDRFSVFTAIGFNIVLGISLFRGFPVKSNS